MRWTVYTIKDPRTGAIRYVGWTSKSLARRLNTHIQEAISKRARSYRAKWLLSLLSIGIRPVIEAIEHGNGDGWAEAERRWIAKFRADGARLVNATDGGEGTPGMRVSEKAKRMTAERTRGKARPPEVIAKWHAAARAANLGRKFTPEHRAKISAGNTGKPKVTTALRRYAEGLRTGTITVSPETRAKQSRARKARVTTDETRARMSAAHKARWATTSAQDRARMGAQLGAGAKSYWAGLTPKEKAARIDALNATRGIEVRR
jgi:hypothetical protein